MQMERICPFHHQDLKQCCQRVDHAGIPSSASGPALR
jgi:hypothetical protein